MKQKPLAIRAIIYLSAGIVSSIIKLFVKNPTADAICSFVNIAAWILWGITIFTTLKKDKPSL